MTGLKIIKTTETSEYITDLLICHELSQVLNVDSRTGRVILEIKFPFQTITSVTFGGASSDTLSLTTSRGGLNEAPA